jgi:hypothetical protein
MDVQSDDYQQDGGIGIGRELKFVVVGVWIEALIHNPL